MSAFPFLQDIDTNVQMNNQRAFDRRRSHSRSRSRSHERKDGYHRERDYRTNYRSRDFTYDRRGENAHFQDRSNRGDRDKRFAHDDRRRNLPLAPLPSAPIPVDENLKPLADDPRIVDGRKMAKTRGGGRNTESFDPKSTLVRPEMRVIVGPNRPCYGKKLKHDDVVIVPEFLCKEDDWSLYYTLVEEMRACQAEQKEDGKKGAEWIPWAEGAHLISQNPNGSKTYQMIQEKIAAYFEIERK